ncbi:aminodeoxychorismate synthase component I [Rhodocista pekingensis]|uniref:aminodeoxychorismate synthase n=1 Tax=Rhodocista pekingensis TaxID=201185 RepID=A0ABW2KYK5_9PROT
MILDLPPFDPADAFTALAGRPRALLLDGAASPDRGRFSYIVADPVAWLEAGPAGVTLDGVAPDACGADPFALLEALLARGRRPAVPGLPPFQGGAVGILGYEAGGRLERLPPPQAAGLPFPDMAVGLYDTAAAFDHAAGRAWVIGPDRVRAQALADDLRRGAALAAEAAADEAGGGEGESLLAPPGWQAEQTPERFRAAIARILDYIRAGDVYQVNYTQRFLGRLAPGATPWRAYRALRRRTAAPFSACLDLGGGRVVASGSPERFLSLTADGRIETRPIKGTRPRGATPEADAALAADLLASGKDRAENLMIVDLLRNDLSRVAAVGSVRVPALMALESYRTVHHLVSVVEARLRPGLGPVDLLRAAFPGGSITGAPKIRAMQIIRELEPARRGPYCGSVVWIGWDGAMDSSIVIRTLCAAGDRVQVQAGGGIVADSDPEAEYQESLTKARAVLLALDPTMPWPPAPWPPAAAAGGQEAAE